MEKKLKDDLNLAIKTTQKQQRIFDVFTNTMPDLIYVFDLNCQITFANQATLSMLGKSTESVIGKNLRNIGFDDLQAELIEKNIAEIVNKKNIIRGTLSFFHSTFGKRYYDYIYSPVFDEFGTVEAIVTMSRDITPITLAEEIINESQEQLAFAIDAADLGVWDYNPQTNKFKVDARISNWFGINEEEENDLSEGIALVNEADQARVGAAILRACTWPGEDYDIQYTMMHRPTGQKRIVRGKGKATFNDEKVAIRLNGILQDVTLKEMASQKLEESENRFRMLADASPILIWTLDANGFSSYYNKTFFDFIGVPSDENISDWRNIVHPDDILLTFDTINEAIAQRSAYLFECRLLRYDKQWRWILAQGNPRIGLDDEFLGFVGSSVDITERKLAEESLKASESKYRQLFNSMDQGFCIAEVIFDKNNKAIDYLFLEVNPVFESQSGLKNSLGKRIKEMVPDLEDKWPEMYGKVVLTGNPSRFIMEAQPLNRWFEVDAFKIGEPKSNNVAILFTDVSERKKTEKIIQESEQRFKNLVKDASVAIIVLTGPEMKVEIVNNSYGSLINSEPHEMLGKPLFDIIPDAEEYYLPLLEKVRLTGESVQLFDSPYTQNINGKQIEKFLYVVYQPYRDIDNNILGVIAIMYEVTEAVLSRKKIQQSEKKFAAAVLAVEAIPWTNNAIGEMMGEQTGWENLTGQSFEDYQGYGWANAVHPEDSLPTVKAWKYAVANKSIFKFEHRVKTKQNQWRLFSVKAIPILFDDGEIEQWVGVHTDITEQRIAIEKIKESEERFRTLTQSLPQLVWITDGEGKFEFGSSRWLAYTGIEPGSEGEWEKIIHPEDIDEINAEWKSCIATGKNYSFDVRIKSKNGDYRWHTVMGEPIKNNENKIIKWVGAFTDTHSEKVFKQELELQVKKRTLKLEEFNIELESKNKELESFNYISSHDLQEPLRKIQMFSSMVLESDFENLSENGKDKLKRIELSANRMQNLIIDLLTYSRTNVNEEKFKMVNFQKIIDDVKDDFSEELKIKNAKITLITSCDVEVIPFQFRQLIQNFISNSLKFAKPDLAPVINITCKTILGKSVNFDKLKPQTKYCCIMIKDNGIGFDEIYKDKIFQVFQRLHDKNKYAGTGIGLSIIKKIIDNHNGFITVKSQINEGTTFTIYIPVIKE